MMLTIVATPIGNLLDLPQRAVQAFAEADIIACEDTRQTRKLLSLTATLTKAQLLPYHDHNGAKMRPKLLTALSNGKKVVLVSDAGTPLISDPGYKLVAACHEGGIIVTSIPGPTAPIIALTMSGLPSDKFAFQGFVPAKKSAAAQALEASAQLDMTQIWFESARRLPTTLDLMLQAYGERLCVIARELTKLHEEIERAPLTVLAEKYQTAPPPRGEIVILVEGASAFHHAVSDDAIIALLSDALETHSVRDAVQQVEALTGAKKRHIYQLALTVQQKQPTPPDDSAASD
jgi:16S rRNA (cytidine1402-2'-O)-methyltransferase